MVIADFADFPDLRGLRRIPTGGATADELAAELAKAPLWQQLPACDLARFEKAVRGLMRAGITWLGTGLLLSARSGARAWSKDPSAVAGDVLELDASKVTLSGLNELARRGWLDRAGGRFVPSTALRHVENFA